MSAPRYVRACSMRVYSTDLLPEDWQSLISLDQPFVSISDCLYWRTGSAPMPHFSARMTSVIVMGGEGFIVDCDPDVFLALIEAETVEVAPAPRMYEEEIDL